MLEITIIGEQKEVIAVIVVDSKKGAPFISEDVILANGYDVEVRKIGKLSAPITAPISLNVEKTKEPNSLLGTNLNNIAELVKESIIKDVQRGQHY